MAVVMNYSAHAVPGILIFEIFGLYRVTFLNIYSISELNIGGPVLLVN